MVPEDVERLEIVAVCEVRLPTVPERAYSCSRVAKDPEIVFIVIVFAVTPLAVIY
jgi:hypothetical protein